MHFSAHCSAQETNYKLLHTKGNVNNSGFLQYNSHVYADLKKGEKDEKGKEDEEGNHDKKGTIEVGIFGTVRPSMSAASLPSKNVFPAGFINIGDGNYVKLIVTPAHPYCNKANNPMSIPGWMVRVV